MPEFGSVLRYVSPKSNSEEDVTALILISEIAYYYDKHGADVDVFSVWDGALSLNDMALSDKINTIAKVHGKFEKMKKEAYHKNDDKAERSINLFIEDGKSYHEYLMKLYNQAKKISTELGKN